MIKRLFTVLVLLAVFGIGSWLRLGGILSDSFAFTYDVGRDMLAVKSIVQDHKLLLIGQTTGVEGIFYGPWWYLILSIPFFIFSGNPQGVAFFMAFVGIAAILLGYILGQKISGLFLGIILSALISFSPLTVFSSSQIWNPNIIPFFCMLVLLVLYSLFSTTHRTYRLISFLLLGLLLGLIIDLEIVFGGLFFVGICTSLVFILKKELKIKEIIFFLFGLLIIFSPRIIFEIRHNFLMTKTLIKVFNNGLALSKDFYISKAFLDKSNSLFGLWSATLAGQNTMIAFILLTIVFLSLLFFYKKTENMQKKFIQTILVVLIVFLIGLIFFNQAVWPHYLVGIPILYIVLVGLALNTIRIYLKNNWIVFIILIVLFWINLDPIKILENIKKPVWEGDAAVYRNQLAIIDYVYKDAKGKDFKYIVYTPAVHDYSYRYLFSWYGEKEYGYVPVRKNTDLLYVILEPDYTMPFRLKDWLKNRQGDGIIQKEKLVKGGMMVQTRIVR